MGRKNIFELLDSRWNLKEELTRISKLFSQEKTILLYGSIDYSVRDFVRFDCFDSWKNRGRYINLDDYLNALDFDELIKRASTDVAIFLTVIEIIYNFYNIAYKQVMADDRNKFRPGFHLLHDNLDICLDHYNYTVSYFIDKEQAIVHEKDAAVTAVAEISDLETAFQIIQYNHHSLKGDIVAKKRILLHLASELESKRATLNGINKAFSDDIFTLLNNLNLRHNNCDPHSKDYKQYVADMTKETLEEWYDELYQMILLAKLELDNLERKSKVAELKTHF